MGINKYFVFSCIFAILLVISIFFFNIEKEELNSDNINKNNKIEYADLSLDDNNLDSKIDFKEKPNINIVSEDKEWTLTKQTGDESVWDVKITDVKDKNLDICFVLKSKTDISNIDLSSKVLYNEYGVVLDDKDKEITLKYETAKCDGEDGYHILLSDAKAVNVDEYIKLGEHSLILEYIEQNKINYNSGFADMNITLSRGDYQVNDIWINYNDGKFGGNRTNDGLIDLHKYIIDSDSEIHKKGNTIYFIDPEIKSNNLGSWQEAHSFDFSDVCTRSFQCIDGNQEENIPSSCNYTADCDYTFSNDNKTLEIDFYSDWFIDPTYSITDINTSATFNNISCEGSAIYCHLDTNENNVVFNFPFDGGNSSYNAYDYGKADNDANLVTAANYINSGKFGDGLNFPGQTGPNTGSMLTIPHDSSLDLNNNTNFTIAMWFYFNTTTDYYSGLMFKYHPDLYAGHSDFAWSLRTAGTTLGFRYWSGGTGYTQSLVSGLTASAWQHVVVIINGTSIKTYYNGVYQGEDTYSATHNNPADAAITVGAYDSIGSGAGFNRFIAGSVDEVQLFNKSLTESEAIQLYNLTYPMFVSGSSNNHQIAPLTVSSGYNRDNVTVENENQANTTLALKVQHAGGTTAYQNLTDGNATFTIDSSSTELNYTFNYLPDIYQRWTPILQNNISSYLWMSGVSSCVYTSGNWNILCSDNCVISSNVTIDSGYNISLTGTGKFEISSDKMIDGWDYLRSVSTCYIKCYDGLCLKQVE